MGALWPMLRRAAFWPAILGFMAFIGFLYVPDQWAAFTAWHLYLDRLHPLFLTATSFAARAAMGAMAALWLLLLFTFLALVLRRPRPAYLAVEDGAAQSRWGLSLVDDDVLDELTAAHAAPKQDPAAASETDARSAPDADVPLRNRWDLHPDDEPRAPLSAQRELPAGGLTAMRSEWPDSAPSVTEAPTLGDPAPAATSAAPNEPTNPAPPAPSLDEEPWLQAVERSGPPSPATHDVSLSALVQRLEARLARRRRPVLAEEAAAEPAPVPVPETPPMTVSDHSIDLALEAALGTLQRMNLRAVG